MKKSKGYTFEEVLEEKGCFAYTNVGWSMYPLLRERRDIIAIQKKESGRCRKYDVVLYKRPPDRYILHRIVEVLPDEYVLLGDNCLGRETGIRDEDILGVMTGYIRDGVEHSVTEKAYLDYTARILRTEKSRIAGKKLMRKIKRIVKRMVGRG